MFLHDSKQQSILQLRCSVWRRAAECANIYFLTPWQLKPVCPSQKALENSMSPSMVVSNKALHIFIIRVQKVVIKIPKHNSPNSFCVLPF